MAVKSINRSIFEGKPYCTLCEARTASSYTVLHLTSHAVYCTNPRIGQECVHL